MKVVIFGATGFSGSAILKEALAQGHQVTILVRDAKNPLPEGDFNVVYGNVMDASAVTNLLKGQDAVINALGIGGKGNGKPTTFISDATKIIVGEMEKNNVKRFVAMSNVGAGDSINYYPKIFTKFFLPIFMNWLKVILDDKNRMEPIITNSHLDWIIVRCTDIVDKPTKGKYHVTLNGKGLKLSITLGDMASFMVKQLSDTTFLRQTPAISN